MEKFSRNDIVSILPHGEEAIYIEEAEKRNENEVIAWVNLTGKEPYFRGHFPGNPILPGHIMIEMIAQAGALLYLSEEKNHGQSVLLCMVNAKFKAKVSPPAELKIQVCFEKGKGDVRKGSGTIIIVNASNIRSEEVACQMNFMGMFGRGP